MSTSISAKVLKLSHIDEFLLEKKGYKIGQEISSGSFARVFKCTRNNDPCAVKVIDLSKTSDDYKLKFLPRELYTMKKLKHPYIIVIYDIFSVKKTLVMIFMELAEGGDLLDIIHDENLLKEEKTRMFYQQFGDALRYMHSIGFAHRDIKCENVLLNGSRTMAKLTDFGFARACYDYQSKTKLLSDTYCGSSAYVAPEVLKSQPYNPIKSDVWSIGILLYVLLNSKLPFNDNDTKKLLRRQMDRKYNFSNKQLTNEAKDVVHMHLNPNPTQRPSMSEILAHRWFKVEFPKS